MSYNYTLILISNVFRICGKKFLHSEDITYFTVARHVTNLRTYIYIYLSYVIRRKIRRNNNSSTTAGAANRDVMTAEPNIF